MNGRIITFIVLLWLFLSHVVSAQAAPRPLTAKDARGVPVTLPAPPRRIVSLAPGVTEILFALGLKGRIVADTTYCDYPPEARALPKIGDVNTSIEKVIAQKPDLIVASASANRKAIIALESLRSARLPIFAIDPNTFPELYAAIRSVGQITGQMKQAETVIQGMQARVAAVRKVVQRAKRRPRVLVVLQPDPLWVIGSGNFMDEMVTLAGGVNITRDAGKGYHPFSMEKVIARRPDIIIAGPESVDRLRKQSGFARLIAARPNMLHSLGPESARPCPRLVQSLERLARILHPDLFK